MRYANNLPNVARFLHFWGIPYWSWWIGIIHTFQAENILVSFFLLVSSEVSKVLMFSHLATITYIKLVTTNLWILASQDLSIPKFPFQTQKHWNPLSNLPETISHFNIYPFKLWNQYFSQSDLVTDWENPMRLMLNMKING